MIVWTDEALDALASIVEFLGGRSSQAAGEWAERLFAVGQALEFLPFSRRMVPEVGSRFVREALEGPYRMWYRIGEDRIDVLIVFHGSRQVPD